MTLLINILAAIGALCVLSCLTVVVLVVADIMRGGLPDVEADARQSVSIKAAVEAGKAAHLALRGGWGKLRPKDYEAIACAAAASALDVPEDFLRGSLDVEMGRTEPMDDIFNYESK